MNLSPPVDRYFVLGNPVAHSLSPRIHAAFAAQTGQALTYGRLCCPLDGFEASVRALAAGIAEESETGPVQGCNVTVPFKFDAFRIAPRHTGRAALAQAANVLRFDPEGWLADNTDGIGLVIDVERNAGVPWRDSRVLVVGAGGAAAGVLGPICDREPASVVVVNRTRERAKVLVRNHSASAEARGVELTERPPGDPGAGYDIVLNATASSLSGAEIPVPPTVLAPGALAVDLMYGPRAQGFLDWARAHGAQGRDGLGMLVEQAAEAFLLWRGVRPQTQAVLQELRSAQTAG